MKARCIEPYFGKGLFFWLVAAYAVIVNALVIPLAYMAYGIFGDSTFISRHAFGITGESRVLRMRKDSFVCKNSLIYSPVNIAKHMKAFISSRTCKHVVYFWYNKPVRIHL